MSNDMKLKDLKPCPFCGKTATLKGDSAIGYSIVCSNRMNCFVHPRTATFRMVQNAVDAWNTRCDG